MKALVVFIISKLLIDRILFPYFYCTVTTRTEIMFCAMNSYETADHIKKNFRNFNNSTVITVIGPSTAVSSISVTKVHNLSQRHIIKFTKNIAFFIAHPSP